MKLLIMNFSPASLLGKV